MSYSLSYMVINDLKNIYSYDMIKNKIYDIILQKLPNKSDEDFQRLYEKKIKHLKLKMYYRHEIKKTLFNSFNGYLDFLDKLKHTYDNSFYIELYDYMDI